MDVIKTRVMLNEEAYRPSMLQMGKQVYKEGGIQKLFSGVVPRTIWMGIGGYVFFFAYEFSNQFTRKFF